MNIILPAKFMNKHKNGYKLIYGNSITEKNILSALQLDYLIYEEIYHLDLERCISYHRKNPYIYLMVVDHSEDVLGYINFSPITNEIYEVIKTGKSIDTIITADDILKYEFGGIYSIYFSSICVHPDYRNKGIANLLLNSLENLLESLYRSNIIIKDIIADAVSKSGERILESYRFKTVCISEHNSKIMEKKVDDREYIFKNEYIK